MERNWREVRTEDERNARAASELSEGGSTKRDPEGNVCDLCSMHKGLAVFLKIEEGLNTSVRNGSKVVYGMDAMSTLDLQET